jgi:hypothetical protein
MIFEEVGRGEASKVCLIAPENGNTDDRGY